MKSSTLLLLSIVSTAEAASPVVDFMNSIAAFVQTGRAMDDLTDLTQPDFLLECPEMAPDTFCEQSWDPVLCDNRCEYGNACMAASSRFDVAAQCVSVAEDPPVEEASQCPTMDPGVFCEQSWEPVVCNGGACPYGNDCEAGAAGFTVATDCVPVQTLASAACPTSDPTLFCDSQWEPVLCTGDCRYDNSCLASTADFDISTECVPDDPTL